MRLNYLYRTSLIVGLVFVSLSCGKQQKSPRPLNVTQKILNSKQGEYQSLYGDSIEIVDANKFVYTKRFISPQLLNKAPYIGNTGERDYSDVFCSIAYERTIEKIYEPKIEDIRSKYPYLKIDQRTDPSKPLYIFEANNGDKKVMLYKDHTYGTASQPSKENQEICDNDEPYPRSGLSTFLVQYHDENSMSIVRPEYSDYYALIEPPARFYRSIESDALMSSEFISNLKSAEDVKTSVRLSYQTKPGTASFSKEKKMLSMEMPAKPENTFNIYDKCGYHLKLVYEDIRKIKFDTIKKWILKTKLSNFSPDSSLNFLKVTQFKL